jgi:DNA-directed RNA polymerase specialized sigma24 family protein
VLPAHDTEPRRELGAAFGAPADAEELGLDDAGLIAEYLGGNPAAYGELVRRHQIAIFRLLLGLLADEDLAEEACEQVFLVAERRLRDLQERDHFYQWLLAISREVSGTLNERKSFDETTAPATADPREKLKREIHAVLQQLPPDQRLVLVLVELRGAPDEDVAAALGCPRAEVPELIAAARAEFARILGARAGATAVPSVAPAMIPVPQLREGDVLADRYRIERLIAEGGMGAVHVAKRLDDGEEVAVKTMLADLAADEQSLRRFTREIDAVKRVDHENFVRVLDHGDCPVLVMELLRGRSLADLLRERSPFDPAQSLKMIAGVLRGLVYAHGIGIIHRDLKLDNVFVVDPGGPREQIKLLDLGLAKLALDDQGNANPTLTERGMIFGTPSYMSPEQALGEECDHRTDLYSVAVMLFQLLTGRLPFESASPPAVLVMHVSSPPPRLAELAPHLDGTGLQALLDRGLGKRPEDRHQDAKEFLKEVEALAQRIVPGMAPPARVASPSPASPAQPTRIPVPAPTTAVDRRRVRRVAAVVLAALTAAGLWLALT